MNDAATTENATPHDATPPHSIWVPLACIAAFMVAIVTIVTARIFPGAPHTATIGIGVAGPFLGACAAKTIGATLRAIFA